MTSFTYSTATDWDAAQSESFVHHEQPAATDWAPSDVVELGAPSTDAGGTALDGYWPLDEDTGTVATDVSGNANDGTVTGATVGNIGGILGRDYYHFDGLDDYVSLPAGVKVYETTNAMTVGAWVVLTDATADGAIVANWDNNQFLLRYDSTNSRYSARVRGTDGVDTIAAGTSAAVATNTWQHVAFTWDGAAITLYVDGVQDASTANTQTIRSSTTVPAIGRDASSIDRRYWTGDMDEVKMYSRALSAAEIQTLAHGDTPTGSLRSAVTTVADASGPTQLTTTSALGGGSINVTVYEDTNQDGIADHSQTVALAGGVDETNSLTGFSGGTNVDYWVDVDQSVTSPTATAPTLDSVSVSVPVTTITGPPVTLDGTAIEGAEIAVIHNDTGAVLGEARTDASGNWAIDVDPGLTVHALAEYRAMDGTLYQERSNPFVAT